LAGLFISLLPKAIAIPPSLRSFIETLVLSPKSKASYIMTIKQWLDSKERDYQTGVKLYAAHPTAMRGLVNNLQRKQTAQMEEKLAYVLEKAAAADAEIGTENLKKKGKDKGKQEPVKETPPAPPAEPAREPEPPAPEAPAEPEPPAPEAPAEPEPPAPEAPAPEAPAEPEPPAPEAPNEEEE
jgi:hypothetical protein